MRLAVIGTNGFLSKAIAAQFKHKAEITFFGRNKPDIEGYEAFFQLDLLQDDADFKQLLDKNVIIYAAGAGIQSNLKQDKHSIYQLNVVVPIKICNFLKAYDFQGTFISFGSYFEIGETSDDAAYSELDVLQSQFKAPNDYSISKRLLSRFLNSFTSNFTTLHFILPTIYGESESAHRLIPYTLKSILENTDMSYTSGDQIRQYLYIDDLITILSLSIEHKIESGIYNINGAEELSVKQLVIMLFKLHNKTLPQNVFGSTQRTDAGMKTLRLNGRKLQNLIGYVPQIKISQVYQKYSFQ